MERFAIRPQRPFLASRVAQSLGGYLPDGGSAYPQPRGTLMPARRADKWVDLRGRRRDAQTANDHIGGQIQSIGGSDAIYAALRALSGAGTDPRGGRGLRPPGSVANPEYLLPDPDYEAEALVRGIYAIAARRR